MVTTQDTDDGLALLGSGAGRDVLKAIDLLIEAADKEGNATSRAWRKRFLALDDDQKFALVDRVVIDDATLSAGGLDSELVQVFSYAITPGKEEAFVALLKGWWAGVAVRLLDRSLDAITGTDLAIQVADIVDQLRADSLPVDPEVLQRFDESITADYQDRTFVHQLAWIALDHERLWKAIRDYHRAYTQRSFWLRYQLVGEQELDRFAFNLHDEWEQVFDEEVARMSADGREPGKVGQDVRWKPTSSWLLSVSPLADELTSLPPPASPGSRWTPRSSAAVARSDGWSRPSALNSATTPPRSQEQVDYVAARWATAYGVCSTSDSHQPC